MQRPAANVFKRTFDRLSLSRKAAKNSDDYEIRERHSPSLVRTYKITSDAIHALMECLKSCAFERNHL